MSFFVSHCLVISSHILIYQKLAVRCSIVAALARPYLIIHNSLTYSFILPSPSFFLCRKFRKLKWKDLKWSRHGRRGKAGVTHQYTEQLYILCGLPGAQKYYCLDAHDWHLVILFCIHGIAVLSQCCQLVHFEIGCQDFLT